jgi:hypothetical protein
LLVLTENVRNGTPVVRRLASLQRYELLYISVVGAVRVNPVDERDNIEKAVKREVTGILAAVDRNILFLVVVASLHIVIIFFEAVSVAALLTDVDLYVARIVLLLSELEFLQSHERDFEQHHGGVNNHA